MALSRRVIVFLIVASAIIGYLVLLELGTPSAPSVPSPPPAPAVPAQR